MAAALSEVRHRLGTAVNDRFPRLSWNLWSARRTLGQMAPDEARPALDHALRRTPRLPATDSPRLLLVVPTADHVEIPWLPAEGNYSFELFETARACLGPERVDRLAIAPGGSAGAWHRQVLDRLHDGSFTHVLGRIDIEPNGSGDWEWDRFVRLIRRMWPGVFLPLTYDSAYPYLSMHLDRLTRLHDQVMPVVLDRPIAPVIRPHRPAAGPLFLPLSDASMVVLDEAVAGVTHDLDVTFIGNVTGYPYRGALLDELEAAGLSIVVNPQKDEPDSFPGFTAYARALARSKITINFSRCNGVPVTQLKTRLLEGSLFGTVVASDSPLYAQDYLAVGEEFLAYSSPADLKRQVDSLLADPERLSVIRQRAKAKAEVLRVRNFWEQVARGLTHRDLAPLPLID